MPSFTLTPNFGLRLYQPGARGWGGDMNLNLSTIDAQLKSIGDTAAAAGSGLISSTRLPVAGLTTPGAVSVGAHLTLDAASGALSLSQQNVLNALIFTPVDAAKLGQPSGVATLGLDSKLVASQFPATLPVANGAALTNLTYGQLGGALPAATLSAALTGDMVQVALGYVPADAARTPDYSLLIAELSTNGQLSLAGPTLDVDYQVVPLAKRVRRIIVSCDNSPTSGNIQLDLFLQTGSSQSAVSLFNANLKPVLVCSGGLSYVVLSGTLLPDDPMIPAGSALRLRILGAPPDADNLRVELYD